LARPVGVLSRAVPSTRVARAYSNSIKLKLYFWARVLENFLANISDKNWQTSCPNVCHTIKRQTCLAWVDANQFGDCPVQLQLLARLYDRHDVCWLLLSTYPVEYCKG